MEHHSHHHSHHRHQPDSIKNIRLAFFLNLGFAVLEIAGGIWSNSVAILSDAVHDLGDSLSLGMAWFLEEVSNQERDDRFSYGYRRFSLLGALINALILLGGSAFVLSRAIPRLLAPEGAVAPRMILFAVLGILINGAAALNLRGNKGLNARMISWHLLEDVLGWTAVLIVAVILVFVDLPILDPILSILITAYIVYNVILNMRETIEVFLQSVPGGIDVQEIEDQIRNVQGVLSTHHTHIWSLDGEHHVLSTHIDIGSDASREQAMEIKNKVKELLSCYQIGHLTLEIEFGEEDCAMC